MMKTVRFSFEKLEVWQEAREIIIPVYKLIGTFPATERYGLGDQLRRSVVSIASNIAEGSGRSSIKEKIHFIEIPYGSLMEVYCQLVLAVDLGYIKPESLTPIEPKIESIAKKLTGLRASFRKQLTA